MKIKALLIVLAAGLLFAQAGFNQSSPVSHDPSYTASGELQFPENYREWVYLSTGFDMSYTPAMSMDHHVFDNVFVNPGAYQAFLKTGTWPDKTMFLLESRRAESKGSINQAGQFQDTSILGREVHVKDESRFPGKWAFFAFGNSKTGQMIPASATCYSCHAEHGAVDTTFVQFYPTLLPIAVAKSTLSPSYLKESAPAPATNDPSSKASVPQP
jgi:cytochrome P460